MFVKLLGSSPTREGITKIVREYFCDRTLAIDNSGIIRRANDDLRSSILTVILPPPGARFKFARIGEDRPRGGELSAMLEALDAMKLGLNENQFELLGFCPPPLMTDWSIWCRAERLIAEHGSRLKAANWIKRQIAAQR